MKFAAHRLRSASTQSSSFHTVKNCASSLFQVGKRAEVSMLNLPVFQ